MSLVTAGPQIQGLARLYDRITGATRGATVRLEDVLGPVDVLASELRGRLATRSAPGGVGTSTAEEAEAKRRVFTRSAPGGVGTQSAMEAEIKRRVFERLGIESGLVGVQSAMEAELHRRMVTVEFIRRAPFGREF